MPLRAWVALIRTTPTTVLQDYSRAAELAQMQRCLDPSVATILRPDICRSCPFPSANTPPWQLDGAAHALRAAGYGGLACEQHWSLRAGLLRGRDLNGYLPVLSANSVSVLGSAGQQFSPGGRRPDVAAGANIVLLPTLKTDSALTIGGALACLAAPLLAARGRTPETLVDALAAWRQRGAGVFALMDGTTAGAGPGPYRLRPEIRNVILASGDPVALDAVAAQLLGFDPLRDIDYLRLAHARGLGVADPRAITLVGDADLAGMSWRFSRPVPALRGLSAVQLGYLGALYHDRVRWPLFERWVFEAWLRGTQWGRLFARYQRPRGGGAVSSSEVGERA